MTRRVLATLVLGAGFGAVAAYGGQAEDSEIALKVGDQLRGSAVVGHLAVAAKARDGRVTLEGRARTLAQAWQAEDLAGKVRGVLEVANRIEIDSRGGSDAAIASAVSRRFEDLPEVAAAGLEVRVNAGRVTLSGKLRDARTRFAAIDAAAGVEGVVGVDDRIETAERDDETLRKEVQRILGRGSVVRASGKFEPTVKDGVVTLEGRVARLSDRKRAERLVLGVNGVRRVEDRLEIKPSNHDLLIPLD